MRLNDRAIRDELRRKAMSVSIPDDMWANIRCELEKDATAAKRQPLTAVPERPRRRGLPLRHMLAIGAAAGIFWMMVIPSSAYVDRLKQPDAAPSSPAAATTTTTTATTEPLWDIPASERHEKEYPPSFKTYGEARRPAPEIAMMR